MHACGTSKIVLDMTEDFSTFRESLLELVKSFEKKHVLVKLNSDLDSNIIRIYGEKSDGLALAKTGLEEIEELALTTAEHHPYWSLLYNGSQILKVILEKWNDVLTEDEIKEILWYIEEIKNSSSNVGLHNHTE
ncbi:MAG: hypothetical protein WAN80_04675 [Nitrosotalea sp.]